MPLALPLAVLFSLLFGLMVWVLPPLSVIVLMVGVAGVVTVLRHPLWGLLLFGVLATFLPYTTINIGFRTTVSELLILLVWGSVLVQKILNNLGPAPKLMRTERWVLALMLFSALPFIVGQLMVTAEGNGPVNWVRWLLNLSVLFLVPRLLDTPKAREQMVIALLLGTLFLLLLSIPVYVRDRSASGITSILGHLGYGGVSMLDDRLQSFTTRMSSPWMHPNVTGGAMALLVPLALCFGVTRRGWPKALGISVGVLGILALAMTGSRGALISMLVVLVWCAAKRGPYTGRMLFAGVAAMFVLLLVYPPLQDRLAEIFSTSDSGSTSVRLDEYRAFPRAIATFPLGIGFKVEAGVAGTGLLGISNLFLNFMYKTGLPGMLLFIGVVVSWWRAVRPQQRTLVLSADNAIWFGTTVGILAALVSGLFDHYFSFTQVLIALFWLMLGLSLHEAKRLKHNASTPLSGVRP